MEVKGRRSAGTGPAQTALFMTLNVRRSSLFILLLLLIVPNPAPDQDLIRQECKKERATYLYTVGFI